MAVNQGDGLGSADRRAQDRTQKLLNYPGLVYFDEKNKQKFIRTVNGIAPDERGNVDVAGGGSGSGTITGSYVQSINGRTGAVILSPANIGAVPSARTVNGKALRSDITLRAGDIAMSTYDDRTVYDVIYQLSGRSGGTFFPLWRNASPGSTFPAQEVELIDEATYFPFLYVEYRYSTTSETIWSVLVRTNHLTDNPESFAYEADNLSWILHVTATNYNRVGTRVFSLADKRTMRFGSATYNTSTANAYVIPLWVFGVSL